MACGFTCELCGKCNGENKKGAGGSNLRLVTQPRGLCELCSTLNKPSAKTCVNCGAELKVPERKVYVPGLNKSDNR